MSENKEKSKTQQPKEVKKQSKPKQAQKDAQVLKLLEQDQDDFQQFEEDAYDLNPPERVAAKQWREDWQDEDINDDFAVQLKKQLQA